VRARGTSNSNVRGSSKDRLARKVWLLANFSKRLGPHRAKCAFRGCQTILTLETVTVDRYPVPGALGGGYTRDNIRPACATHNYGEGVTIARLKAALEGVAESLSPEPRQDDYRLVAE
jgi:hypothetical protein